MAAPSSTVWGSIAGSTDSRGAQIGIYVSQSNTSTKSNVTVEVWFRSKNGVTDSSNNLYFNNADSSGSATADRGAVNISVSDTNWSTANEVKIWSTTYEHERTQSSRKRYLYAKLTGIDRVAATLYASTTFTVPALASYAIKYDANGGSGAPSSQTKWYGTSIKLSTTKPTRTGHSFRIWLSTTQSQEYDPGDSYGHNASTTMKAQWTANTYTVKFNANGGSGAPSNQTKTYGTALKLSSTIPIRPNYNFKGWGTSASATTVAYAAGGSYTNNAAVTLYAVWELAYIKPRITGLVVDRNAADATKADVSFSWATDQAVTGIEIEWSSVSGGSGSQVIDASGTSDTVNATLEGLNADYAYTVTVTVTDSAATSESRTLGGTDFLMDFLAGGQGIVFGKHIYDRFNTAIHNGLAVYGDGSIDPDTTLEPLILTENNTPLPEAVNSRFMYVFTYFYNTKSTTAARAQIAIPYSDKASMYHRYYWNGAWSDWRRHVNEDELSKYFPIAAGSANPVTGEMFVNNKFHIMDNGTTVMDLTYGTGYAYVDAEDGRALRLRSNSNEGITINTDGIVFLNKLNASATTTNSANTYTGASSTSFGRFWRVSSLRAIKKDIEDVTEEEALKAYELRPRTFRGINEGLDDYRQYGFVAEEVEEVLPDLATREGGKLNGVAYDRFCSILLKQNQMQKATIDKLTALLVEKGILTQEEVEAL